MTALSRRRPDRVPIDLGSTRDSSIVAEGYTRLAERFGVGRDAPLTSRMMQAVEVDERILRELDIDTRGVFPAGPPDTAMGDRGYRDEWGIERRRPEGAFYYDQVKFPLSGPIGVHDIAGYRWPDPSDPARTRGLRERIREIRRGTDCAIVLNLPSAFVHTSQYLRGFEDWFLDIAADPRLACCLYDAVLDVSLGMCRTILGEVGGDVDVLMASDDLGLQDGLMIPPETYRSLIKPRHARYVRLLHDMSGGRVFFHTCGAVSEIVEDLIDIGVDALNPVQVSAAGMDPAALHRRFGGRIAFWGAVDTQRVLPFGSVAEVEAEVERRIEELGRDGGYVLSAVHNIQPDVGAEKIVAMYRHARAYVPSWAR